MTVCFRLFFAFLLAFSPLAVNVSWASTQIASAVEIDPQTYAFSVDGKRRKLNPGDAIFSGETIKTNRNGYAIMKFTDSTEITVGPNSKLNIDDVAMASSSRASNFVVSAVTGSFRFVSGKSRKDAYQIKTPTATLGIRGTEFIIRISRRNGTQVEVSNGKVNFCDTSGCADVDVGELVTQECRGNSCQAKVKKNENPGQGIKRGQSDDRNWNNGNGNSNAGGNGNGNSNSNAGGNGNGNSGNSSSNSNGNSGNSSNNSSSSNGNSSNSNSNSSNGNGSSNGKGRNS